MHDPKKVLEICAAATRGPWATNAKHYEHCIVSKPLYDEGINYLISGRCCLSQDDDFVVLARTALPEFAQRVIDLEQQRREDMELMEETLGAQKMALAAIEKYKSENTKLRAAARFVCDELEEYGLYAINILRDNLAYVGNRGESNDE